MINYLSILFLLLILIRFLVNFSFLEILLISECAPSSTCIRETNKIFKGNVKYLKNFFENLQNILPCPTCAKHYQENLKKFNLDEALESKDKLIKWLIDIHNEVNKKNNKRIYEYDEVIKIYNKKYSENKSNYGNKILIGIVIVFILYILINCR